MGLLDTIFGQRNQLPIVTSILPEIAKQEIWKGNLPNLKTDVIFLRGGEKCSYIEKAILVKEKTVRTYRHVGGSVPGLFKGTRINMGKGVPVEHTEFEYFKGILYITNKRLIFQAKQEAFEKKHGYLTAISKYADAVELQYGNKTYTLLVPDGILVDTVLHLV